MEKEKAELIQEALDTLQAVTLSGRSVESYVAELFENIRNLEEENKKLKKELGEKIDTIQVLIREKYEEKGEKLELFKENKKLKEERDKYYAEWHLRHS